MFALFTGMAAGLVHVLSGPDHLAAVAPLAAEQRRRAWVSGFVWGAGHTSGVWIVGLLALLLSQAIPWERLALMSGSWAGVALVGVGLWGLWRVLRPGVGLLHRETVFARGACLVGVLHGLAGSSHYVGVAPALAFASQADAFLYLCGYGLATIATMVAVAAGLGSGLGWARPRLWRITCSAAACAAGIWAFAGPL